MLAVINVPQTKEIAVSVPQSYVQTITYRTTQTYYLVGSMFLPTEYAVPRGSHYALYAQLNQGVTWNIWASTLFPLDFYVMNQDNYQRYSSGMSSTAVLTASNIGLDYSTSWTVPSSETWYFVFTDRNPLTLSKVVGVKISQTYLGTQTASYTQYSQTTQMVRITVNQPLFPPQMVNPGVVAMLLGIVILGLGIAQEASKKK